ncbi:mitogen-activated protein kinase kinase [Ranunculus cassubicifolius]
MSLEVAATVATPIIERSVDCVSDATTRHLHYLTKFSDNYESLVSTISDLVALKGDVERRVAVEEASQQMERTHVVAQWLQRTEAFNQDVDLVLHKCSIEIGQRCCGDYCPKNWWARYKLGKKVCNKLIIITELITQGKFDTVADRSLPIQVQVQPENITVGMNVNFGEVWSWLEDDQVKIIGIYGMGGVGKTTLLKKINNAFAEEEDARKFDMVIWVVVSSQFSLQNVQKQIGNRLGLTWSQDGDQIRNAQKVFSVLSKKKFLLLLDDLWETVDLEAIGVPSPHISRNNSKVVFTTRSEKVCGEMDVSKKFKVPVLGLEEAWELFQQKVGLEDLNSRSEILELAKAVAKECGGLPLALITVGRAMASKKTTREWNHAMNTLILSILKFSYDSLEDDTARECFLYCSLYPEDYDIEIEEIVKKWVGEGFLDRFKELDDALNKGHDIVGTLKAASLLETGDRRKADTHVKMHDIVRDLALWIAREYGKNENKYLVQAGVGMSQAPEIEGWKEAERISLMLNQIKELAGAPECPHLSTLMLQRNYVLLVVPNDFFQHMSILRVLDLGGTIIRNLPQSIGRLLELRYLNLSETKIATLPYELRNLVKLKYLDLRDTNYLEIPHGIISCFSRLQVLLLGNIYWDGLIQEEWEALQQLRMLDITINKLPATQGMILSQRSQSCIEDLRLYECSDLTELALMSSSHLGKSKRLRKLRIVKCSNLQKLIINSLEADKDNMGSLLTLEILVLINLPKLSDIIWAETATDLHFKHLATVYIRRCGALKNISWILLAPSLRDLKVYHCQEVEEIILDTFATKSGVNRSILPRLVNLELVDLPKLKSVVKAPFSFPSLCTINVHTCPLLKKLPFASNSINNSMLQKIQGEAEWWNNLEWEDETIKTSLQTIFVEDKYWN